uniref:Uncharacterized protein n=1 Tax=Salmonella enteritidis TaxID=149539 RepID=A0A1S6KQV6_SALEN|nr:hypothetical protein [Salmonella enterica subsp. enterica serovar Enteritidis]
MHDMFNVRAFKEWWIHNDNIKSFIGLVPKKVGMHQLGPVLRTLSFFTARNRSSFNSIPVINASGAASFKAFRMRPSPNSGSRTRSRQLVQRVEPYL